jgi:hypothetical protein
MKRGPSRVAPTKALLSALAAGAPLDRALLIAAHLAPDVAETWNRAAVESRNDAFRADVLARLGLEPPAAAAVLGRAKRERFGEIARLALEALRAEEPKSPFEASAAELYLVVASVTSILVSLFVLRWLVMADRTGLLVALGAAGLALAASSVALIRKWPVGARSEMLLLFLFPPLVFFRLSRVIERASRPLLDARRVLLWLAAGEIAGLVPGAVIAALALDVRSVREHRLLRKLENELRGAADARRAAEVWISAAKMPEALVRAAAHPLPGDTIAAATERLARLVALVPPRARIESILPHAAIVLLAVAAYGIAGSVLFGVAELGVIS